MREIIHLTLTDTSELSISIDWNTPLIRNGAVVLWNEGDHIGNVTQLNHARLNSGPHKKTSEVLYRLHIKIN